MWNYCVMPRGQRNAKSMLAYGIAKRFLNNAQ